MYAFTEVFIPLAPTIPGAGALPATVEDAPPAPAHPEAGSLHSEPTLPPSLGDMPSLDARNTGLAPHGRHGRYHLLERLGAGGMGVVHKAWDPSLRRTVALKQIHRELFGPEGGRRFVEEAAVTAGLEHPGIVPVYDLGTGADGVPFFTMKEVRGQTLQDAIAAFHGARAGVEPWTLFRLVDVVRRVAETLAFAHDRGVLHRDLKPANVMVGHYGEVLVMDWGLARALPGREDGVQVTALGATRGGHAMGTPAYMAPEQACGDWERVDARSDVWGLGAILYEVLTGQPPHGREEGAEERAKSGLVEPVLRVRPDAPRELAAVAEKALEPTSGARYPGAAALAADLAAWQEGRPVSAYRYTALDRARRLASRHRRAALAGTGMLAVLAGVLAVGLVLIGEQRDRAINAEEVVRRGLVASLLERASEALADGVNTDAALLAGAALKLDPSRLDARGTFFAARGGWSPELLAEAETDNASCRQLSFSPDGDRLACVSLANQLYFWSVADHELRELDRAPAMAGALAFSSDGARLAVMGLDNAVILRDGDTGAELKRLQGHDTRVWALQFLDQDRILVSGDKSGRLLVWDVERGELIRKLEGPLTVVTAMAAPADGRVLHVEGIPHLFTFDTRTWEVVGEVPALSTHRSLEVSPDGATLFASELANGGEARPQGWDLVGSFNYAVDEPVGVDAGEVVLRGQTLMWAATDGAVRQRRLDGASSALFRAHVGALSGLAASADGRLLATSGDQRVRLWTCPPPTPSEIRAGLSDDTWQIASVDGGATLLAGGKEGHLREIDLATGQVHEGLDLGGSDVTGLAPVDDGRLVYASTMTPGRVLAWDRVSGSSSVVLDRQRSIRQIAADPAGRYLAIGPEEPGFMVLDTRSGEVLWKGTSYVERARISPDGERLLLVQREASRSSGVATIVATSTGRELARLEQEPSTPWMDIAWSHDGALAALIGVNGRVEVWDTRAPARLSAWPTGGQGQGRIAWSHDGRLLATAHRDGDLSIWSASDGRALTHLGGLTGTPHAIAFSPDDHALVTAGAGQPLRILKLDDLETGHEALVARAEQRWGLTVVDGQIAYLPKTSP